MSKGSTPRRVDAEKWRANYAIIFGKKTCATCKNWTFLIHTANIGTCSVVHVERTKNYELHPATEAGCEKWETKE